MIPSDSPLSTRCNNRSNFRSATAVAPLTSISSTTSSIATPARSAQARHCASYTSVASPSERSPSFDTRIYRSNMANPLYQSARPRWEQRRSRFSRRSLTFDTWRHLAMLAQARDLSSGLAHVFDVVWKPQPRMSPLLPDRPRRRRKGRIREHAHRDGHDSRHGLRGVEDGRAAVGTEVEEGAFLSLV